MKLKFELEDEYKGMIILESSPQSRSIFTYRSDYDDGHSVRLPFPYLEFIFNYEKIQRKGKFLYKYKGLYGHGLRVFAKLTSLKNPCEDVYLLPIEIDNFGTVCTDHAYDNKCYNSVTELANEIISVWWGHLHYVYYVDTKEWAKSKDLTKILIEPKSYGCHTNDLVQILKNNNFMTFDKDSQILEENWPCGM